ncbi:MAG: GGDEF domain-containing protein [Gammaproteobacteria bacterium]|nr:GGDEF domain-containing protein [Gammaproteobacteria bacterium]
MSTRQQLEICPVDRLDCQWLQELSLLRSEVAELKLLVTTDTLTGLNNLRYFQENLSIEMERTLRAGRPTSIIMIDLDFFKAINDERGHEAGNQALKVAAAVFKHAIRLSDVVCRYGGEEFVIILPQTTLPTAVNVAERVRLWLEQALVEFEGKTFTLTASLGVGVFSSDSELTRESFVDSVDQYLYQAKEQGRNQVCHADFSTMKTETSVSAEEKSALFGSN